MSMPITVIGNLTADPELVQTQSGVVMVTFTMAETTRKPVPNQPGQFQDGNASFYRVRDFNGMANNTLASLHKGDRAIVQGDLEIVRREVPSQDGGPSQWFTDASILANEVGVSLRFAKVDGITKTVGPRAVQQPPAPVPAETVPAGTTYLDDEQVQEESPQERRPADIPSSVQA